MKRLINEEKRAEYNRRQRERRAWGRRIAKEPVAVPDGAGGFKFPPTLAAVLKAAIGRP